MARLQILELPTIYRDEGPDETPFILVIDQWEIGSLDENAMLSEYWDAFANKIGARGVLCTDRTIEIPVNETPVDPDGYPLKIRVEPDFEAFRQQVEEEIRYAEGKITRAVQDAKLRAASEKGWTGRPTRPDGTPYGYSEITEGGWEACEGCRTWGQWTPENPHDCPGTYIKGPIAKPAADA